MISRVKKNQELYNQLTQDTESDLSNSDLASLSQRISRKGNDSTDSDALSVDTNHDPLHSKSLETIADTSVELDYSAVENHDISIQTKDDDIKELLWNTFENTYLNDFLNEVKQYNVKKGYRRTEDTQANILASLNENKGAVRRHQEIEQPLESKLSEPIFETYEEEKPIEDIQFSALKEDEVQAETGGSSETLDQNTIALEVQKMLREMEQDFINESAKFTQEQEQSETRKKSNDLKQPERLPEVENLQPVPVSEETKTRGNQESHPDLDAPSYEALLASTQQLKVKVNDYEEDLQSINNRVAITNRVISFVLYLLIVALVVVIVVFVYYFVVKR